jgi:hypothetical protein
MKKKLDEFSLKFVNLAFENHSLGCHYIKGKETIEA